MFVSQFVYCIISDHTDGTAVQRATNNVDACTQCAYLFFSYSNCFAHAQKRKSQAAKFTELLLAHVCALPLAKFRYLDWLEIYSTFLLEYYL